MIWLVLVASTVILAIAFLLRRHAQGTLAALNMTGEVVYSDCGADDEVLVSHVHGLSGKPDYILSRGDELIPVERKSRSVSAAAPMRARSCSSRLIAF